MPVAPHQLEAKKKTKIFQALGKILKEGREKSGYTQREISIELGYSSPQFVSNIERGLCAPPLNVLQKMVAAYGLPPQKVLKILIDSHSELFRSVLLPKGGSRSSQRSRA